MKINTLLNPLQRLFFVLALSVLPLPLFAGPAQEAELDALLRLKKSGTAPSQLSPGENGITQNIEGEYLVVTKGDMTIRMPLAFGLDYLQNIIAMLNSGLTREAINGKWEVLTEDGENSGYVSFEFEGTNVIVVKNAVQQDVVQYTPNVVYAGPYTIKNNEIVLDDFGSMKITYLEGNSGMEFSFSSEGYDEIPIKAQKAPGLAETEQTKQICRTWKLIRRNGGDTQATQYEDTILFTKSGTYLVTYLNNQELGLAQWRWVDGSDTEFEYSWDNWEESGLVQIQELTSASFKVEDKADVVYEFVPLTD